MRRDIEALSELVGLYMWSSTPNRTKKFKITVDDSGALTATEITA